MKRTGLLLAFGLLLLECSGGSKPACNATTCATGCCDSMGICQLGTSLNACGKPGGAACSVCGAGKTCQQGSCTGGSGGGTAGTGGGSAGSGGSGGPGGGSAGGSAGTGGGSSGTGGGTSGTGGGGTVGANNYICSSTRTVTVFTGQVVDAGYDQFNWVVVAQDSDGGAYDELGIEMFQDQLDTQPVPGVTVLDGGDDLGDPITYTACGVCPLYFDGCTGHLQCTRAYMGISGTVDILHATQGAPGSTYTTLQSITFYEWDFDFDEPVANGRCVVVQSATIDAGWN